MDHLVLKGKHNAGRYLGRKNMRAPAMTPERAERENHYAAVKAIVGDLSILGGLKPEDHKVYNHFFGTLEAVAARILAAREARASK
jgi:hypothetical protein